MHEKNQEDFKVIEEVFDRLTLEGVYRLMRKNEIDKFHGVVKSGKEARIFWGENPEGDELAIKIYYTWTADFRKGMMKYLKGDERFKRIGNSPRSIIYTWTKKEYKNLQLAEKAGVNAPRPLAFFRNILVMTFIGEGGIPAPVLKEVDPPDPSRFYDRLLHEIRLLYENASLVHGDLSEYNIMLWEGAPVIFDVSQAILKNHPLSDYLIQRDIANINKYFRKLGVDVREEHDLELWIKGGTEDLY
jgi:RIO kinase 1